MSRVPLGLRSVEGYRTMLRVLLLTGALLATALLLWMGVLWELSKYEWAAWVQAIGSVTAVLTAVVVVKLQHRHDALRRSQAERATRRRQLNALRWIFISVAETCENVAAKVHCEHVAWRVQAELLQERRKLLTSLSVAEFPDSALLLRSHELAEHLYIANAVTESLELPRKEEIRNKIADILRRTRDVALTSVTEVSHLLVRCSTKEELEIEWRLLDDRGKNYEMTKQIYAEVRGLDDPSNMSFQPTASSELRPPPPADELPR